MVIRTYLDACLDLPWNKAPKDRVDVAKAKKETGSDHYGMAR
jgi:ATP-dependent Lon protease